MKIAYIFLNNLKNKSADVNQAINFAYNFSKKDKLIFFSSYISRSNLKEIFNFFLINKNFKIVKSPFFIFTRIFFIEKIGRFFCCLFVLIYLKFKKFNLIYTRDFSFIYFLSFVPKFLRPKIKIIFESHKIYFKTSKKVSKKQERKAYSVVNSFISTTFTCKKDLINFFKIQEEKIDIFPGAVDVDFFNNFEIYENKLVGGFFEDKKNLKVVYSGSFISWKGIDVLINSLKYLDDGIKVLIFGGDKNDLKGLLPEINKQINKNKLILLEKLERKDMTNLLLKADVGVLSNNFDNNNRYTSPMKIPEYMAAGLSIVAPDIFKNFDFFKNNNSALFFETGNSESLAEKINYLNRNKNIHDKISRSNLENAKNFDANLRTEIIKEVFRKNI